MVSGPRDAGKAAIRLFWLAALGLLVCSGVVYRLLGSHLRREPVYLPVALKEFPYAVSGWEGKDVSISETVQEVAGNDDFLNRLYAKKGSKEWANVYVAYSARPRTMVGHRPDKCYVGAGWEHDGTKKSEIILPSGRKVACLVHQFHLPEPRYSEQVVLNYYVLNGQITADESGFTGLGWRRPNIAGQAARYVAQVQISSVLESSVRMACEDLTDAILEFLPDKQGRVLAEQKIQREALKIK